MNIFYFIIFYTTLIKLTNKFKNIKIASIFHSLVSFFWLFYIFKIKLNISFTDILSNKFITKTNIIISEKSLKNILYSPGIHSIAYFASDTFFIINSNNYTYLLHHILTIIMTSSIFLGSSITVTGLLYGEMGSIFHHLKNFKRYTKNKNFKFYLDLSYIFIYGVSRYLLITNSIDYLYFTNNPIDKIQIFLFFPLFIQNLIWLYKNSKKLFIS